LETIRQYARDRLQEIGESEKCRDRHLNFFLALAEDANPELRGANQRVWLERLEVEHDNVRAALTWSYTVGGNFEEGLRLSGAIYRFWFVRGHLSEGRDWLASLLAANLGGHASAARACALNGAGGLAFDQGEYPTARAFYEQSLVILRELGDRRGIALSLNSLGNVALEQCDYSVAREFYEQSLVIFRELDDRRGIAGPVGNLGAVAHNQGDYPTARSLLEESLAIFRELGDQWGIANVLNRLGDGAFEQGDYLTTLVLRKESLAIFQQLGDRGSIALSLEGLARLAAAFASFGRAARIWGAAERMLDEVGAALPGSERPRYEGQVAAARTAMQDDEAFDRAWQAGRDMTMELAIELALRA